MLSKTCKIDLRLIKNYGLNLDTRKKYFMIYDPQCWSLWGVYDNLEDALKFDHSNLQEYNSKLSSEFDANYVGHNWYFSKGFFQNLSVWSVLVMLRENIIEDDNDYIEDAIDYTLSCIHPKMHSYPEYIKERCEYEKHI